MVKKYTSSPLIKILATVGYAILALLVLQALALIVMCTVQYYVPHSQTSGAGNTSTVAQTSIIIGHEIATTLPNQSTITDRNFAADIAASTALLVVALLLVLYLAKIMSAAIYSLLRYTGTSTVKRLLTFKLSLAGSSFAVIVICALLLPDVMTILLLNTGLVIICLAAFLLEHSIIMRYKITKIDAKSLQKSRFAISI